VFTLTVIYVLKKTKEEKYNDKEILKNLLLLLKNLIFLAM